MTLQSLSYWLFLPAACLFVALVGGARARLLALVVLSLAFYATWEPWYPLLLLASTAGNYWLGCLIRRCRQPWALALGIAFNVSLLAVFKYGGLWTETLVLPVGLSFFTFQGLSHLIDTYREDDTRPTGLEFAAYMAFWPTLLAGPITRAHEIVLQLRRPRRPDWDDVCTGARRIVTGLFMKMVIADTLARGVLDGEGVVFGFDRLAAGWSGLDAWFLAVGFGFQLYFDFAGYSHVAIGSARLLGVRIRENFDHPYLADSPIAFWSRWHMSLSQWIRDYIFFPLAMSLPRAWGRHAAVMVAMLTFGAWHGVGWTFVLWGLYHGVLQLGQRLVESRRGRRARGATVGAVAHLVGCCATFALVSYGWLLFRSSSPTQAWALTRAILDPLGYASFSLRPNFYIVVTMVAVFYFVHAWMRSAAEPLARRPYAAPVLAVARSLYYGALVVAVIIWSDQSSVFVYFQF